MTEMWSNGTAVILPKPCDVYVAIEIVRSRIFLDRRLDNFKLVDITTASTAIDTLILDDRK